MKTRRELNLEYWGDWHRKCKGTALEGKEWLGIKLDGDLDCYCDHPGFNYEDSYYEIAIAVLEDRPVFAGDKLWSKFQNRQYVMDEKFVNDTQNWSWTPPAMKRTFVLNGVELPCPLKREPCPDNLNYATMCNDGLEFYFESCEDKQLWRKAITRLLTEARDKE